MLNGILHCIILTAHYKIMPKNVGGLQRPGGICVAYVTADNRP